MIPPASDRWELISPVWNLKFVKKPACFDKEENTKAISALGTHYSTKLVDSQLILTTEK